MKKLTNFVFNLKTKYMKMIKKIKNLKTIIIILYIISILIFFSLLVITKIYFISFFIAMALGFLLPWCFCNN